MKRQRGGAPTPRTYPVAKVPARERLLLLFETPSGFAVFRFTGSLIDRCLEEIWTHFTDGRKAESVVSLQGFETFKDKSSAINQKKGVNKKLSKMLLPGTKIAVGKPEYKEIIEKILEIDCLYNEAVMEVMWGIQNCMQSLVPSEKSQLAEEDRLPMSKGLQKVLERHGCNVKPEMVNEQIVVTAYALFRCDYYENECSLALRTAGDIIKDVSGISCEGWSLLKIATALKMIWEPEEVGDSCGVNCRYCFVNVFPAACYPISCRLVTRFKSCFFQLSNLQQIRLTMDAHRYERRMVKFVCLRTYEQMVETCDVRTSKKELLKSLVEGVPRAEEPATISSQLS